MSVSGIGAGVHHRRRLVILVVELVVGHGSCVVVVVVMLVPAERWLSLCLGMDGVCYFRDHPYNMHIT